MERQENHIPSEAICALIEKAARAERRAEKALSEARAALRKEAQSTGRYGCGPQPIAAYLRENPETGIACSLYRNHSAQQAESLIKGRIRTEREIAAKGIRAA